MRSRVRLRAIAQLVARLHGVQEVVGSSPASPTRTYTEESHSGLVRTLGKRVWGNPPRVRISPLPPGQLLIGATYVPQGRRGDP